jgi:hypothetical protein
MSDFNPSVVMAAFFALVALPLSATACLPSSCNCPNAGSPALTDAGID